MVYYFLLAYFLLLLENVPTHAERKWHSNQFLVRLHNTGDHVTRNELAKRARSLANDLGFDSLEKHDMGNRHLFVLQHRALPFARSSPSHIHLRRLAAHPHVAEVHQAEGYKRLKRGYKPIQKPNAEEVKQQRELAEALARSDPIFAKEWYIHNTGQADGTPGLDLNVLAAWNMNFTGRNIVTAIMDDGVDYLHPDLAPNYAADASYDFSSNDAFPYPRYTDDWFNSHGTRCAGEISAVANNGICGVGVAPNSKVAGLRMLDQPYMTDLIEAAAMAHARDQIDIYSASWGPTDDGKTVDGPRNQTMRALVDGVNLGRKGKGSLYVWASGDGGSSDDCNCDGYAASMWTISINSATNDGQTANYAESCASTLASTFSNGKSSMSQDAGVATVDLYGNCTLHHSGTSAAAPEAAGVFALALEANPELTWRDVQHLTVLTSKRNHLFDREMTHNWTVNGAGLEFNHLFGYGVLDAGDMVKLAKVWKKVPERFHCIAGSFKGKRSITVNRPAELIIDTNACKDMPENQVNFIEHVQAFITVKASRRGDLTIFLTSPMNTTSMLLSKREHDNDSKRGFFKWPFMTTQMWDESPRGKWRLWVGLDPTSSEDALNHAVLLEWILIVHGTAKPPYGDLPSEVNDIVPKLAIVKREHKSAIFAA